MIDIEIGSVQAPLDQSLDTEALRRTFGCVPSSVVAVAAYVEGAAVGLAASTFVSVSLTPALVSFCIQRSSSTWPVLKRSPRLGLSVLADGDEHVARQLAGPASQRFRDLEWSTAPGGAVLLARGTVALDCSIEACHPAGDHDIVVLRVHGLRASPDLEPLVFHSSTFRRLVTSAA